MCKRSGFKMAFIRQQVKLRLLLPYGRRAVLPPALLTHGIHTSPPLSSKIEALSNTTHDSSGSKLMFCSKLWSRSYCVRVIKNNFMRLMKRVKISFHFNFISKELQSQK